MKKRIGQAARYYWQPPPLPQESEVMASLTDIGDHLSNLHVFQWNHEFDESGKKINTEICLLEEGIERWRLFFAEAGKLEGNRYAFLEFARDGDPKNTRQDAVVLNKLLAGIE